MEYDIALSFAGEDREYVEQVAEHLQCSGVKVFYDKYEQVDLWGKDLYEHLSDVYQNQARFTVMFISRYYAEKLWTRHERKNAQARAFREKGEYILPARFDDTELPGLSGTVGYLDLRYLSPAQLAEAIRKKLSQPVGLSVQITPVETNNSAASREQAPLPYTPLQADLLYAASELRELKANLALFEPNSGEIFILSSLPKKDRTPETAFIFEGAEYKAALMSLESSGLLIRYQGDARFHLTEEGAVVALEIRLLVNAARHDDALKLFDETTSTPYTIRFSGNAPCFTGPSLEEIIERLTGDGLIAVENEAPSFVEYRLTRQGGRLVNRMQLRTPFVPTEDTQPKAPTSHFADFDLHGAAGMDLAHIVRERLGEGADISAYNDEGFTALHVAAKGGALRSAAELLAAGADMNARDQRSLTPLLWAIEQHNLPMVKLLLDHGATPTMTDDSGRIAPLSLATDDRQKDIVALLKQRGAS